MTRTYEELRPEFEKAMLRTYEEWRLEMVLRDLDAEVVEIPVKIEPPSIVEIPVKRLHELTDAEWDKLAEEHGYE